MTIYFSSHDLKVYRRRRRSGTDRYGMSVTLTVVQTDIQPADVERQQLSEGKYGSVYDGYVDSSIDIKEGDQVVDVSTGKRYSVRAVTEWANGGLLEHKELLLVSQDGGNA